MSKRRIMVVEDEGIVSLDIQTKLDGLEYEVAAAVATGEEAVKQATELRPDLVLMDIQLAGVMDGIQAAEAIRHDCNIPVVYLTAYSDDNTLDRAKTTQPFGYLLKPFAERELHTSIEVALYKHEIDAEKTRLEMQLHQARKMEAIAELTTGIAQNFNNMLHGIMGNVDLALMSVSDRLRPYLEAAQFDGQKAAQLIKQLMLFYHQEPGDREVVDIGAITEDVVKTCSEISERRRTGAIDFSVDIELDLPTVHANAPQLRQCLSNLCVNAQEALEVRPADDPRSSRIEVRVRSALVTTDQHLPSPDAQPGSYVRIDVADNGTGMDAQTQERIYEPFFTTKTASQGTGLGLAMCYSIVKDYQGWIACDTEPGVGTTFSLYLPIASDAEDQDAEASPEIVSGDDVHTAPESLRGSERVLVVADVDRFRRILTEMLEKYGYEVLLGIDVRDGLDIFAHEKETIGLVVLDLYTPGMSSQEVLTEIISTHQPARVLVVTGYTASSAAWSGARAILNKPFNSRRLLQTVRRILDD